ncbi:cyanophycinase [Flammeovirga aprica]|uniref:Cyanophycinase n=1 Tax=Flammeovirga aprica JL-4 TaxID=694437 RepID=A0A7X9XA56_9BACT|nr:cyanophycinase [Flammeovirga aprica]NME69326.1 cyanophycinase [Flammeovirga aprica JL-4]
MRQYYYLMLAVLVSSIFNSSLFAQDIPLLLVGGGSEIKGGWSDEPYQWFVDQSENKKVAIISYAEVDDDWLKNYFLALGAEEVKDFKIDRTNANNADLISELRGYTAFFFKGGDQNKYYSYYKNSSFHQLLEDKITDGVVLGGTSAGMAILASIVYTAERGSLYPEDGFNNMDAKYFTFQNDFLNVLPNTLVDTHFAERGRLTRLMSMLAYWNIHNSNDNPIGIGVDDRTALCIDKTKVSTVYGTGAVSFITLNSTHNIAPSSPLQLKNNQITSCIHGQQYNLTNQLKLSADSISKLNNSKIHQNKVSLINGGEFEDYLQNSSKKTMVIYDQTTSIENTWGENVTLLNLKDLPTSQLEDFKKTLQEKEEFLLLPFGSQYITDFYDENSILNWVLNQMKSSTTQVYVFDEAIPFAGAIYASNLYANASAAYNGNLSYKEGLGLIEKMLIVNDIFKESDYSENLLGVLQEGLMTQDLQWTVGITEKSVTTFQVKEKQWEVDYSGESSSIVFENQSDHYSLANSKRAIVGYPSITSHVIFNNTTLLKEVSFEEYKPTFNSIIINDLKETNGIHFQWKNDQLIFQDLGDRKIQLIDFQGRLQNEFISSAQFIDLPIQSNIPMIIRAIDLNSGAQKTLKIKRN